MSRRSTATPSSCQRTYPNTARARVLALSNPEKKQRWESGAPTARTARFDMDFHAWRRSRTMSALMWAVGDALPGTWCCPASSDLPGHVPDQRIVPSGPCRSAPAHSLAPDRLRGKRRGRWRFTPPLTRRGGVHERADAAERCVRRGCGSADGAPSPPSWRLRLDARPRPPRPQKVLQAPGIRHGARCGALEAKRPVSVSTAGSAAWAWHALTRRPQHLPGAGDCGS